jgi:DNA-binding transcriptional LysR family regulator
MSATLVAPPAAPVAEPVAAPVAELVAEPSWDLYGAFLAVMHGGSLSAASRALRVAQPTVRRQIEALEAQLGVVLFTRAPNGLVPTELAHATLPHAEAIAAAARALVRSVSAPADAARGTVRLACSEIVGVELLPALLAPLLARHPQLRLELVLSNRNEDLLRRDADLAVRMVRPTQTGLVSRLAARLELGLFATAGYLAARGTPATLAELTARPAALAGGKAGHGPARGHAAGHHVGHALIGSDRQRGLAEALAAAGLPTRPADYALRSDSDLAQLAAVRAGLGIGVCQAPIAARDRELRRVLPKLAFHLEAHLVMHEDLRAVRRVRLVFDHLVGALAQLGAGQAVAAAAPGKTRRLSARESIDSQARLDRRSRRGTSRSPAQSEVVSRSLSARGTSRSPAQDETASSALSGRGRGRAQSRRTGRRRRSRRPAARSGGPPPSPAG